MKSTDVSALTSAKLLRLYYAGTLVFIILDYFFGINVRLAFLEARPGMRALYYFLCLFCLGLMFWRPDWSLWIGTLESALALSLLIVAMGVRVMTMSEQLLVTGTDLVTMSEIMNFMIVGMVAWFAWMRGIATVSKRSGVKL